MEKKPEMSFLKDIAKKGNEQIQERVKQTVKQKKIVVKQKDDDIVEYIKQKQETFEINPTVISLKDIPNTNIMTSGKLIGVHLRAEKKEMLKKLMNYIGDLIKNV